MRVYVKVENDAGSFEEPNVPAANALDAMRWAMAECERLGLDPDGDVFTVTIRTRPESQTEGGQT